MLSASVQVPLPLFVASRFVWEPTVTRMVAVLSFVVPVSVGRLSLVTSEFTVMVGAVASMISSPAVASLPALPSVSVAVAATL